MRLAHSDKSLSHLDNTMTESQVHIRQFDNGLTLVVEPMANVRSAAFSLMVPCGSIYDPRGHNGTAAVLCDHIMRGAGARNTRELSTDLDNLGMNHSEHVGAPHMSFRGVTLAENLLPALEIYADVMQQPRLPESEFAGSLLGVEQSLRALEDEPRQKSILELRRRTFPHPWGLPSDGTLQDLPNITAESMRDHYETYFRPDGAILGVAGDVVPQHIEDLVDRLFGSWKPKNIPPVESQPVATHHEHLPHDSTQTHIGIAYRSVPYRHPEYYSAWAAVSVLSGGMSSRLFTEVREHRGLCYAVHASLTSMKDEARVLCYAGTTAERAQETLDVTLQELQRLSNGIAEDELKRCKARAKSALVMEQESTIARSSSVARDWYHLGRITSLDEVSARIDALTVETILEHLHEHPIRDFTILTIGPEALEVTVELS